MFEIAHFITEIDIVQGLSTVAGIDIGSRLTKGALFRGGKLFLACIATGVSMQQTADELLDELAGMASIRRSDVAYCVATGYGRISVDFPDIKTTIETEVFCHALGAHKLNDQARYVIDIGGQDCKAIEVGPAGDVANFAMNDKCSAGTGRYLERASHMLGVEVEDLGELSLRSRKDLSISNQCVVFAESEIVSLLSAGEHVSDVAKGVHQAVAKRVYALGRQIKVGGSVLLTGGVSRNVGMKKALEDAFQCSFLESSIDTTYAGAIGAAAMASVKDSLSSRVLGAVGYRSEAVLNADDAVSSLVVRLSSGEENRKKVGFLCTYTPPELFRAFGAVGVRLFKAASPSQVASGEHLTRSVYCDFIKGTLGAFREKDPFYSCLDAVMSVYTCDCTKRVGEALRSYGLQASTYVLPRYRKNDDSVSFFAQELESLSDALAQLIGEKLDEDRLRKQIHAYNKARNLLKTISMMRTDPLCPVTSSEYTKLIRAYWYIEPEQTLALAQRFAEEVASRSRLKNRPLRIMMAGGVNADNDDRILRMLEHDLGVVVAVEDTCAGFRSIHMDVDESDPSPLHALAKGYLEKSPCARMKPFKDCVEESLACAETYQVDAVVYTYVKFCTSYGQGKRSFAEAFESAGYPTIDIGIDFSQNDYGQLKTRLETFVNMVRINREQVG